MKKKPVILNRSVLAQSALFDIEGLHLRFSNGQERHFERIRGHGFGAVMIIPLLDEDTVLLVREYSAGMDEYVLGFPKGAIESDEDILVTAERELKEEVGYGSRDMSIIAAYSASPGYLHSKMDIIWQKTFTAKRWLVMNLPLEVIPWRLSQMEELLAHPEFHEARSVAALFLVERHQRGR
ncbi:ADP compounds hydrolase NudE [Coxiella burnetii]|uniref:ADP compounds hydrolase NudE n=1 Tax=Coxiella burnetii TaxID=777 RepID=UPI0000DAEBE9|nr:ADP compounds hydrolase NudE [Coxiella burnetii]MDE3399656.1 ADP compounds hydrolase NudE [Coxiella burnetii]PNT83358.1 ADP compounds hydrolase NudE [Coxiella burnetii]POZ79547.1 ADP compounds hydrolase NudE [Coxiella burnetii]RQM58496.1 ADP compounds hydrolase NudE [Coxiella burnetii]RQM65421.1 ADP compounds hydrolase NudE [Coxiella burnetii]